MMQAREYQGQVLAFVGDAVISLLVREYLVQSGYTKSKELQEKSVQFVSAKAQAEFMDKLLTDAVLDDEEIEIYKRGRNHKSNTVPKNADVIAYRKATGLEALFGYWHLDEKKLRLETIFRQMLEYIDLK